MEVLKINGTSQNPTVLLDKAAGKFEFSGNSLPEDAVKFYAPIISWIEEYVTAPNVATLVHFKMQYYNSPSSKQIFQILKRFEALRASGFSVDVQWSYGEDDVDIEHAGRDFSAQVKLPFKFVSYSDDDN